MKVHTENIGSYLSNEHNKGNNKLIKIGILLKCLNKSIKE